MKRIVSLVIVLAIILMVPIQAFATETITANDIASHITEMADEPIAIVSSTDPITGETTYTATEVIVEDVSLEDVTAIGDSEMITPYGGFRYQFHTLGGGNLYYEIDDPFVLSSGEMLTLDVTNCVWAPETNTLHIGVYNFALGKSYSVPATGGSFVEERTYLNLPAGEYYVFVKNTGSRALTTGYMTFTVSIFS